MLPSYPAYAILCVLAAARYETPIFLQRSLTSCVILSSPFMWPGDSNEMPSKRQIFKALWIGMIVSVLVIGLASSVFLPVNGVRASGARKITCGQAPSSLADYERWFGSEHAHTGMDGDDGAAGSTAAQAFAYAKNLPHLDYFIITPHVHQSRSGMATLWSEATYDLIRASAISATTSSFVAIAGQEVSTISSGGHWSLFNANDMVGADHPDGDWNDADDYYDHVAGLGVNGEVIAAQFDHPQSGDFGNRYDAGAAPYFGTFAVSSGPATATTAEFVNDGSNSSYQTRWANFLNMGWKLSPAADQDNHGATWGASSSEYTVIVRPHGTTLNAGNVIHGLSDHMTYATEDANMQIGFTANGWSMGQTVGGAANIALTIWWNNPSNTLYNNNTGVTATESANDAIGNIWIYKNSFNSPVATYTPTPSAARGT